MAKPPEMTEQLPALPAFADLWQQTLNWQPSATQQQQFQQLYEGLLAGNRQLNLTRITTPEEFWEKHLWDSLRGIKPWLATLVNSPADPVDSVAMNHSRELAQGLAGETAAPTHSLAVPSPQAVSPQAVSPQTVSPQTVSPQTVSPQTVIDIGTGGGFPGIPIAIARPDWQMTLLDSTRKKVMFLQTLVEYLGLTTVHTRVDRAEQAGQTPQQRSHYDLAMIRAVGPATVCAEYALPLLKVGGQAVLYRGQWTVEEETALAAAVQQLGGAIDAVEQFTTPLSQSDRHCLYLRKQHPTPARFPRAVGVPTQKPLP